MTALLHSADNVVVFVDFGSDAPPPAPELEENGRWPWESEAAVEPPREELPAATGPLPLRWSPRPVRVLRGRFARSQLAADLRRYRGRLEFLLAAVAGCYVADQLYALIPLFGGPQ